MTARMATLGQALPGRLGRTSKGDETSEELTR